MLVSDFKRPSINIGMEGSALTMDSKAYKELKKEFEVKRIGKSENERKGGASEKSEYLEV